MKTQQRVTTNQFVNYKCDIPLYVLDIQSDEYSLCTLIAKVHTTKTRHTKRWPINNKYEHKKATQSMTRIQRRNQFEIEEEMKENTLQNVPK